MPINVKMAILKKKKMMHLSQEDEAKLEMTKKLTPHFMITAPRSITEKEAVKNAKAYKDVSHTKVEIDKEKALFKDNEEVMMKQNELRKEVKELF